MTGIAAEFATPKVMMPQVTKWSFCPEVLIIDDGFRIIKDKISIIAVSKAEEGN